MKIFILTKKYSQAKIALENFNRDDGIYYWYKIKKNSQIIFNEEGQEKSSSYLKKILKNIKNPSVKVLFDMGNLSKSFKNIMKLLNIIIKFYPNLNNDTLTYADVLYRRGGGFERLGNYEKSDKDLLKSLEIDPDDAYVLNYLAYSWLERKYKIDKAMQMLEKAYQQEPEDPYIIDSIGWAHYLTGNYIKAEQLLKVIQIMPYDPIVNDHYGDILWKLDRKIEAVYYWNSVLNLEDAEDEIRDKAYFKVLKGFKKT